MIIAVYCILPCLTFTLFLCILDPEKNNFMLDSMTDTILIKNITNFILSSKIE